MRYPDGGGLNAVGRARREKVRLQVAQLFEEDMLPVQVAHQLRVSTKSAYQWRRCWRVGGAAALASRGAGGRCADLHRAGRVCVWLGGSDRQERPNRSWLGRPGYRPGTHTGATARPRA